MKDKARFLRFVKKTRRCWLWQGGCGATGYGRFHLGSATSAHRAAYRLFVGEIPPGKSVLHRCDVRNCVRPGHLFLGTQYDNVIDMKSKGRHAYGPAFGVAVTPSRARGERSGRAKLTDRQVAEIRASSGTAKELSAKYGVHPTYISMLRKGHYRKPHLS